MALILRPPEVCVSLSERLDSLRRARTACEISTGVLVVVAYLTMGLTLSLAADLVWNLPAWVRACCLAILLAGASAIATFCVLKRIRKPIRMLDLAFALERRHPELNDALASAASFSEHPPQASGYFLQAAMQRAEKVAEPVAWTTVLPWKRFWSAFWIAATAFVLLGILVFSDFSRFPLALKRLLDPYGGHSWPARTNLRLGDYTAKIATGDSWTLSIVVSGVRPETAQLLVRSNCGESTEFCTLNGEGMESAGQFTLDPSRTIATFDFRVIANDADSGWRRVVVAPPPRLMPRDGRTSPQLRLAYPAYLGWDPLDLPDGVSAVEAVTGTRVTLSAATDRPIAQAMLQYQGDRSLLKFAPVTCGVMLPTHPVPVAATAALASAFTAEIPVIVSGPDRQWLDLSCQLPCSGLYALCFTDDDGLTGKRLLDFRSFPDPAPRVTLLRPDPTRDTLDVLLDRSLNYEARADDRTFAVRTLQVEYRKNDGSWLKLEEVDFNRWSSAAPALIGATIPFSYVHPPTLTVAGDIRLSRLPTGTDRPLKPGDTLTLRGVSQDWDDVSILKAPGRSNEVTVRLHSRESLEAELQRQMVALREPLARARDAQTEARKATEKVEANHQHLPEAERSQSTVRRLLADNSDGLRARAARIAQIYRENAMPPSATTARIEALNRALARIEDQHLAKIDQTLAKGSISQRELQSTLKIQRMAEQELAEAAADLDRWAGLAELQSDAQRLANELNRLTEIADRLRDQIPPGVSPEKLSTENQAALARAAAEHSALAESLRGMMSKIAKMRELKTGDEARKLEAALEAAQGTTAEEELRKSSAAVAGNRLAEAAANRESAAERLRQVRSALGSRTGNVEALRNDVEQLVAEQDLLTKKVRSQSEASTDDNLAKEQEALRKKAEKLAESLQAEQQMEAAETLRRASEKMDKAAQALRSGNDATADAEQAAQELVEAKKQASMNPEAKNDLAREQQDNQLKEIKALLDRQTALIDESLRITATAAKAGQWERPLIAALAGLADNQESLAREVRSYSESSLTDAPVFERLTDQAAEMMERAVARLKERKEDALTLSVFVPATESAADDAVRKPMREALRRLEQIVQAIEDKPKSLNQKAADSSPADGATASRAKPQPLAQLKALRNWQAEVQERTVKFANANPDSTKLSDDARAELAHLHSMQAEITRLFELLRESLKPMGEMP